MDIHPCSLSASAQGSYDSRPAGHSPEGFSAAGRRSAASPEASPQAWPEAAIVADNRQAGRSLSVAPTATPRSEKASDPGLAAMSHVSAGPAARAAEPDDGRLCHRVVRSNSPSPPSSAACWRVAAPVGVNVRSRPDRASSAVDTRSAGCHVYGEAAGDWLALDDGGYVLIRTGEKMLLEPVDDGSCSVSKPLGGGSISFSEYGKDPEKPPALQALPTLSLPSRLFGAKDKVEPGPKSPKPVASPRRAAQPDTASERAAEPDTAPGKPRSGRSKGQECLENTCTKFPGLWVLCWLLGFTVLSVTTIIIYPLEVDTDVESTFRTDVVTSLEREAFEEAIDNRVSSGRRLAASAPMFNLFDVFLAYELKEEGDSIAPSLVSSTALKDIAEFERDLRGLFGWSTYCARAWVERDENAKILCDPGISLAGYSFPAGLAEIERSGYPEDRTLETLRPNGWGDEQLPVEAALSLLDKRGLNDFIFPTGYNISSWSRTPPQRIRSVLRFKIFCCWENETQSVRSSISNQRRDEWKEFACDTILPFLRDSNSDDNGRSVTVYYDGTLFQRCEVLQEFYGCLLWVIPSVIFLILYLLFHTRSLLLAWGALFLLCLSMPVTYLVFVLFRGQDTILSIAMFIAFYVAVGLGTEIMFVYTDCWRISQQHSDQPWERIVWTYKNAGMASLGTTVTIAVAFFCCLASVLRPLREFGLFMGLWILIFWALVSLVFLPMCLESERLCRTFGWGDKCCNALRWEKYAMKLNVPPVRWFFWVVPTILAIVFCCLAWSQYEIDMESASIFAADHNLNRGKEVFASFEYIRNFFQVDYWPVPPQEETVCDVLADYSVANPESSCALFACEATPALVNAGDVLADTTCVRNAASTSCGFRIVGLGEGQIEQAENDIRKALGLFSNVVVGATATALPPVLLEEFNQGLSVAAEFTDFSISAAVTECQHQHVCFRKNYECQQQGWTSVDLGRRLDLVTATPATGEDADETEHEVWVWSRTGPRRLSSSDRAVVDVAFGLKVGTEMSLLGVRSPSWGYLGTFSAMRPWAQRDMYKFCTTLPDELRVIKEKSFCWIEAFKSYVEDDMQDRFPVPANRVSDYLNTFMDRTDYDGKLNREFFWFASGEIQASYFFFTLEISTEAEIEQARDLQEKWDAHLASFNLLASKYTTGAIQTSRTWATAMAQDELIDSMFLVLGLIILLAFLVVLCFIRNLFLSLVVTFSVFSVVSGLAFFIVIILRWRIGALEVIGLIAFVGFAWNYCLHVVYMFCSRDASLNTWVVDEDLKALLEREGTSRLRRVAYSLQTVGFAIFGSAVVTVGCTAFLLFCTPLVVKWELGLHLLVFAALAFFVALLPLPAFLLTLGPTQSLDNCMALVERLKSRSGRRNTDSMGMDNSAPPLTWKALNGYEDDDLRPDLAAGMQVNSTWHSNALETSAMRFRHGHWTGDWIHLAKLEQI